MANYPQAFAQDAVCQSHTGHMTGLWFLPTRPLRLNTNEWMNEWMNIYIYTSRYVDYIYIHSNPDIAPPSPRANKSPWTETPFNTLFWFTVKRWRSWLKHCATNRKVAGSIADGIIGIFHWHNPSGSTIALGLTHPLTEMSTRNISWGVKAAGAYGWQPYHLHFPIVLKSGRLSLLEPSGSVQACNGTALPWPTTCFYSQWPYAARWST